MSGIWLPGYTRINGRRSGSLPRQPDAPSRCVLHTDEVGTNTRSLAQRHEWPPQLWVNPATRERYQLISLDRTGYALKASPQVETNHMGRCVQVEIAGHARDTHTWPDEWLEWLAREVIRPIHEHAGVPLVAYAEHGGDAAAAYGARSSTRMSIAEWRTFSGFCAHQNVPDNDHWDAGRLPLGRIIRTAAHLQEDDDMATLTVIGRASTGQHYRIDLGVATPISPQAFARLRYLGVTEVPASFVDAELDPTHGTWRVVGR